MSRGITDGQAFANFKDRVLQSKLDLIALGAPLIKDKARKFMESVRRRVPVR